MKSKFSILGLFLVSLLISTPLFAAVQVTATVSDNYVVKGDIFILTVTINDNDSDYQLDTRPLEDTFTIYRPSQSQLTTVVNFDVVQKTQWKVRLEAQKTGKITIPSLKIGDFKTDPIEIEVVEPSQAKKNNGLDRIVFLENSIDKSEVYIGQSFILSSKIYISRNINNILLEKPYFEGAETSLYGEMKTGEATRKGLRYSTGTQQYKMTATQAGQFEIDSTLLTGTLRERAARPINIRGERLNITVKAIPDDYQGEWIVSDDLRLFEESDLTQQSYKVGDPITRSITLQIASIDKDKLPTIKLNYPTSMRFYPDQDQLQEDKANGLTYGVRIIKHAIIADKEGTLTLPEIKLNWFNSRTNKAEVAILPAQTLTILPADQQPLNVGPVTQPTLAPVEQTIVVDHKALIYWQIAVAVLIVLLLLMVFYHLAYRRSHEQKKTTKVQVKPLDEHYLMLQNSLKIHDAPKCYSMLLKYAQQQYPDIKGLSELAAKSALNEEKSELLKHEIQWLQICCSDKSQLWNANKLSELIRLLDAQKDTKTTQDPMNLNP